MSDTPVPPAAIPLQHPLLQAMDDLLGLTKITEETLEKHSGDEQLTPDELEAVKRYEQGLQKMLVLIAPAGMQIRNKDMVINDQFARTLYAYNWPNFIYPNWMAQTINQDVTMDISQFIYPSSNKAIMKMLRKKVAELRSSIRMLEQRGIVRDPTLEAALQDAEELRDLLARARKNSSSSVCTSPSMPKTRNVLKRCRPTLNRCSAESWC
jgi:hypothetical protein